MFLSKPMLGIPIDHTNPLNRDLVLDYAFNEGYGDIVNDLSGHDNHGTLNNFDFPPTRTSGWNPGMDGVALNFDGSDDLINCGNNPSLDITDAITIDALINTPQPTKDYQTIASRSDNTVYAQYVFGFYGDTGKLGFASRIGGVYKWYAANTPLSANIWYRVIVTFDGIQIKWYLNGVNDGTANASGSMNRQDQPVLIGITYDVHNFIGSIARARILSRAYSPFEVMQTQINPYGVYQQ